MGETEFKHIAVTAAEDDDFVIRAGVSGQPGVQEDIEPEPAQQPKSASEPAVRLEPDPEPESEPEPERPTQRAPKPRSESARVSSGGKREYRETTLEDLNSTKMPIAQKVVIIAAIVCIIGAVAYYFAFLR